MSLRLLLAEFSTAEALIAAARAVADAHHGLRFETFTPFPVEAIDEIRGEPPSRVRTAMVIGGFLGAVAGFGMQYYSSVYAYPINSGGRPYNAWPAFMLVTFEFTVLFAALAGFFTMLFVNGLPRLHHPIFEWDGIERASDDRFLMELELTGDEVQDAALSRILRGNGALAIRERVA
ncbi:DUF3341 domain-containing protein [Aurantimonas sp. VKM B-3413]|uniref:DUF3341 domain-containing protein n=1 Tax=Aurantimonas sp. VKM B-3413 TaxID=2779401 RepID=UPI001E54B6E2|nr:DUF3341 domain-containing protein [Aurantimonas sp. VKM B-3413]MCB8839661.1 DUF3341 domain-containing protein [Aurantimonas sp. VKM B-3413]